MKQTFFFLMAALALILIVLPVTGQDNGPVHGPGFVDEDGDGVNDNAPDHDQDGIPNGQDPDYERQTGVGKAQGKDSQKGHGFVDMDGDGLNDWAQDADGDGVPNGQDEDYIKPQNGSGSQSQHGRRGQWGGTEWQSGQDGSMDCMSSENRRGIGGQRGGHGKK
jgi:hypothetical protein